MNRFRSVSRKAMIVVMFLGMAVAAGAQEKSEAAAAALDHPMLGQPAPGFELKGLDGETVDLADFVGSYLVIHFGASW